MTLTEPAHDINHARLLVSSTQFSASFTSDVENWLSTASIRFTALAHNVHHTRLHVLDAETSVQLTLHVEGWPCGALQILAVFLAEIDHAMKLVGSTI